jgi:hypothetical protein
MGQEITLYSNPGAFSLLLAPRKWARAIEYMLVEVVIQFLGLE